MASAAPVPNHWTLPADVCFRSPANGGLDIRNHQTMTLTAWDKDVMAALEQHSIVQQIKATEGGTPLALESEFIDELTAYILQAWNRTA